MPFTPDVSVCQVESNLPGEDRYVCRVTEDILTYGIYDGHGGYLAADIACATLQDMIIADIQSVAIESRSNLKIAEIIDTAFITVDDMIIAQALRLHRLSKESSIKTKSGDGEGSGKTAKFMGRAGSCAVVVVITGGMLFVAHVGYGFCFIFTFWFLLKNR
jgi:serine/threonine protein phosphatase PrpC